MLTTRAGIAAFASSALISASPVASTAPPPSPVFAAATTSSYALPVAGATGGTVVLRPFEPPPTPYAAGHRGVDLAVTLDKPVRAAAAGTVSFAGLVAGRGVVVIAHPEGISTEYEPVASTVHAGDVVTRGDPIGSVVGSHGDCPPASCLHWGARRDRTYLDPMSLLTGLGPIRLIAW